MLKPHYEKKEAGAEGKGKKEKKARGKPPGSPLQAVIMLIAYVSYRIHVFKSDIKMAICPAFSRIILTSTITLCFLI
jgi:hypothetical protein